MPIVFAFAGVLLLVAAVRDTQDTLFGLVKGDFSGPHNFIFWVAAILLIGMVGYIKPLKDFSTAFLVLLGVVILLSNKGFFANFQQQISSTTAASGAGTAAPGSIGSVLGGLFSGGTASGTSAPAPAPAGTSSGPLVMV